MKQMVPMNDAVQFLEKLWLVYFGWYLCVDSYSDINTNAHSWQTCVKF